MNRANERKRLRHLMGSMLYPAVLGAGFVGMITQIRSDQLSLIYDPAFHIALIAIILFIGSSSPLNTGSYKYTIDSFWYDVIEVSLMFVIFFALDLFNEEDGRAGDVRLAVAVAAMVGTIWTQWGWDLSVGNAASRCEWLTLRVVLSILMGASLLVVVAFGLEGGPAWIAYAAVMALLAVGVVAYVLSDDAPHAERLKTNPGLPRLPRRRPKASETGEGPTGSKPTNDETDGHSGSA